MVFSETRRETAARMYLQISLQFHIQPFHIIGNEQFSSYHISRLIFTISHINILK